MKILRLELKAFGPFTDRVLDLSAGQEGLHVIFGVNEAGKSTALRGLEQLFFGMPERTGEEFLHASLSMRLGATLQHSDGSRLTFWRRRARKVPLYAADDRTPLDAGELGRFLGKLDQGLFASMFGLNRATLERAGREILSGGGQLGQILFAAASGLAGLRAVQHNLEKELELLFKPTGRIPRINQAFADLRDARERQKQHQLPGEEWLRHDLALRQAEQARHEVQEELDQVLGEERRLTRLRDALPVLTRRRKLQADLDAARPARSLPDGFAERRRRVESQLAGVTWKIEQTQQALAEIEQQLAVLQVPTDVLERADAIEDLHRRLGEYQRAERELAERESLVKQQEAEVRTLGRRLGHDGASPPALRPEEVAAVRKLAVEHPTLQARLDSIQTGVDRLTCSIEQDRLALERLEAPIDVTPLGVAVRQAQLQGPVEEEWSATYHRAEQAEEHTARLLQELDFAGSLSELLALDMPSPEVVDEFQERWRETGSRCEQAQDRLAAIDTELAHLDSELHQLELDEGVPSEADLHEARTHRNSTWEQVRQAWFEGQRDQGAADVADAFERSVKDADSVADRLRTQAERVAHKVELLARTDEQRRLHAQLVLEQARAESAWEATQAEWNDMLGSLRLTHLVPRDLRAWLAQYQGIVQQDLQAGELRARALVLRTRIDEHAAQLVACIGEVEPVPPDSSLCALLTTAQQILEREDSITRQREDLERDLAGKTQDLEQLQQEHEEISEELARWQTRWTEAVAPLRLPTGSTVIGALNHLEALQDFVVRSRELTLSLQRTTALREEFDRFARDVHALSEGEADPATRVVQLHERLKKGRDVQQRRGTLSERRASLLVQLDEAHSSQGAHEDALKSLCEEAGCTRPEELQAVEECWLRKRTLERDMVQLDQVLQSLRGEIAVDEFSRQVAQVDPGRVEVDLAALSGRPQELARRLKELDQAIGKERNILDDMDGASKSAADAEQAQFLLAQLQTDAREYFVRRLAMGILQESIDRYRNKSEGQVVQRASELFAALTIGAFEGLNVDTNEQGETVLTGVRAGDRQTVNLEAMSDGTRDQLFLALRLASLEVYLEAHEPIPFIVDDLLLNFDDERARAALEALAQLSRRTQVLFFTHHQHLVELAQRSLDPELVFFHSLPEWKRAEREVVEV